MADTLAQLFVKIGADVSDYEKKMNGLQGNIGATFAKIGKVAAIAGAAVGTALVGIGVASTKMAMDAVESENLFDVSMGGMAAAAREWSKELSKSLGLNQYELRKNVGMFNAMFKSMQMGEQASLDMSEGLTQLAYDMASFYNLDPAAAFDKLRSGITGETEPLKALGIVINDTAVQAYALQAGLIQQGQTMTEQQKIAARYALIMQQTSQAQGDLARTASSPTNQLRILKSTLEELGITIGMAFIPMVQALLDKAMPVIRAFAEWVTDTMPKVASAISGAFNGSSGAAEAFRERVLPALQSVWSFIQKFVEVVRLIWAEWGDEIMSVTSVVFSTIGTVVKAAFDILGGLLDVFIGLFTGDWGRMGDGLKAIWNSLWDAISTILTSYNQIIMTIAKGIGDSLRKLFLGLAESAVSWGRGVMQGFMDGLRGMMGAIWKTVKDFVDNVVDTVKGALGIHSPSKVFAEIGANVGRGLALGIEGSGGLVDDAMASISPTMNVAAMPAASGRSANIVVELDGRVIARAIGQPLVDEIRVRTGLRI